MFRHDSLTRFRDKYLTMIITHILVFQHFSPITAESISSKTMSSIIQDLSLNVHDYKSDGSKVDSHPLSEGFILLSDHPTKSSSVTSKSTQSLLFNQTSILHSTSSTTCKTVTNINTIHHTSTSTLSSSLGHRGRRLLNEPSSDHDLQTSSTQTPMNDENEIDSFLKVDEEEMNRQLVNMEATTDGSGETADETTTYGTSSAEPTTASATPIAEITTDSGASVTDTTPTSATPIAEITTDSGTSVTDTTPTSATPIAEITTDSGTSVTESTAISITVSTNTPSYTGTSSTATSTTTVTVTTSTTPVTVTSSTTLTTVPPEKIPLRNTTNFILTIDCVNASSTLAQILEELDKRLPGSFSRPDYNASALECNNSTDKVDIPLDFITDNDHTTLNNLYEIMENVTKKTGGQLSSVNICGNNSGRVEVKNVTSCYLIRECGLCGTNPRRGECYPESGKSACTCFVNEKDPSILYEGDLCFTPPRTPPYSRSRWTPIIVGVLAGLTALFCATTCCLWAVAVWRRRRRHPKQDELRIRRIWHLPRAEVPKLVTTENVQNYIETTLSTANTTRTDSSDTVSNTTDSTFFKELDQKMGENLRATRARPNTSAMLASLPSDTISTHSTYDPIDELDAIIDNEDLNTTFHDPLDELYDDKEMLEVMNPNLTLPRPSVNSKPTGLFSYF